MKFGIHALRSGRGVLVVNLTTGAIVSRHESRGQAMEIRNGCNGKSARRANPNDKRRFRYFTSLRGEQKVYNTGTGLTVAVVQGHAKARAKRNELEAL